MTSISEKMEALFTSKFEAHGPTPEGVFWGPELDRFNLRFEKMLALIPEAERTSASLLDVGCGFGGLLGFARANGYRLDYTGVDLTENMIAWCQENWPDADFLQQDILKDSPLGEFDYVVANGLLALKLDAQRKEMDAHVRDIVRALFAHCKKGIAFNCMTDRVNFYSDILYYRNPLDFLGWCQNELSPYVKLDHAYPLHEYTIYVYREPF